MTDTRLSDSVSAAKSAGFKVVLATGKTGKNTHQIVNAAGVPVQLGTSEEDAWLKAFRRGILPELRK